MAGMQKTGHATCIDGRYLENSRYVTCIEGSYVEKSGRTTCIDGMPVQCRQHPPPELEKPLQKDYIENKIVANVLNLLSPLQPQQQQKPCNSKEKGPKRVFIVRHCKK
jgi:hypothetical protein